MKRLALVILAALSLVLMPMGAASAHILAHNNGMDGILHIDPNDSPVAGKPAVLHFYMSSTNGVFTADDCGCALHITYNGAAVVAPNPTGSGEELDAPLTFAGDGAYTIGLDGASHTRKFDRFALTFVLRVTPRR